MDVPAQRGMTRRIAEVAGIRNFCHNPLMVELKDINVRVFVTRGVGRSAAG